MESNEAFLVAGKYHFKKLRNWFVSEGFLETKTSISYIYTYEDYTFIITRFQIDSNNIIITCFGDLVVHQKPLDLRKYEIERLKNEILIKVNKITNYEVDSVWLESNYLEYKRIRKNARRKAARSRSASRKRGERL